MRNMDFNKLFEVEFTEQYIEEMTEIYDYISDELKENESAKRLINEVNEKILSLAENPNLYMEIGKVDRLKRAYHRMVVRNYVVLYTVDYESKKVFASRIVYGKRNYLN